MPEVREFLSLKQVESLTGRSRSTIYRMIAQDKFPASKSYQDCKGVFWVRDEVAAWQQRQIEKPVEIHVEDLLA